MDRSRVRKLAVPAFLAAGLLTASLATSAAAILIPGTPAKDVTVGLDNDNAGNPFIQPPGVNAKQHMDNTDILFGRANDDLLIGRAGSDTLIAGTGADILIGGPENAVAPNSDVLLGEEGDDVNIWAPGDGSDAFSGKQGHDTMVFAPFLTTSDGSLLLERYNGRQIPRVTIDAAPQFSCTIVSVPASEQLGFQHLVRFNVNGVPAVTVRQEDVERVLCPGSKPGTVKVAQLDTADPKFVEVPQHSVGGLVGAIIR